MRTLSHDQLLDLLHIVEQGLGVNPSRMQFADLVMQLSEDIPGLETMTAQEAELLNNQLWNLFMTKNQTASNPAASATPQIDLTKPAIKKAIAEGKALIADGKTKADAARAMYPQISTESKETIIAAFVEGATLTPKGAQTYWYNCRRKASKEKPVVPS